MRTFRSEFAHNYQVYAFGYTVYARRSSGETRAKLLEKGFLPYTGDIPIQDHAYYLARSLRVPATSLEVNSENRRVLRKFEPYDLKWQFQPKEQYDWSESDLMFCDQYARDRFSKDFSEKRLNRILDHDHCTHICRITHHDQTAGLILLSMEEEAWHYWFAFFSLEILTDVPLGKWAMTSFLIKAHENNIPFVYLGTCYGKDALYKVRDFNDISYFDGNQWVDDKTRLKKLCKNEEETNAMDLVKKHPLHYENIINQP